MRRSRTGAEPARLLHDVSVVVIRQPSLSGSVLSVLIGRGEARGEAAIGCPGSRSAFLRREEHSDADATPEPPGSSTRAEVRRLLINSLVDRNCTWKSFVPLRVEAILK